VKKILVYLTVGLLLGLFTASILTSGDTVQVTLTYTIPTVTTFNVQYPTGESGITFEPTGASFTDQPAKGQGASICAMNVTNTGNTNIKIDASLTTDLPTGVTEFRLTESNSASGGWYWTDANETTSQTIISSLASSSVEEFWAWTTGSNVPAGTYTSTKLELVSSAV